MKKYKEKAGKFFYEKVVTELPDWKVESVDVATGEVLLFNDDVDVSVVYDPANNTFDLTSIKIKTESQAIDNDSLMEIYKSMVKGVLS